MHIISETRGFISALLQRLHSSTYSSVCTERTEVKAQIGAVAPSTTWDGKTGAACNGAKHQNGIIVEAKCISRAFVGVQGQAESRLGKIDESSGLDGCDATAV